jgi:DNA repair protein RecN (Recombination protein N)
VESARLELEDIAAEVESLNSRTEASPERLEAVEERLSLLYGLLQKHGVGSLEELMDERDRLEGLVLDATTLVSEVERARKAVQENSMQHESLCAKLHAAREKGAQGFAAAVQEQLRFLELDRAVFQIGLEPCAAGADGNDNVRFLFSAEGRTPSDVSKTASGGELSRIMLSLKAVMARFKRLPTLVFDEIDTGVSGSAADKMGSLVCTMGTQMQVFAITHLPQVAAKGNAHYLVSKEDGVTSVRSLDAQGRVLELARMLSGATITPAAIANAQALLKS